MDAIRGGAFATSGPTKQLAPPAAAFERELQEQKNQDMMERAKAMGAPIPEGATMPEGAVRGFPGGEQPK